VEEVFHSLAYWEKKELQYLRLLMERRVANVCGAMGTWMSREEKSNPYNPPLYGCSDQGFTDQFGFHRRSFGEQLRGAYRRLPPASS
jgi:hypothetical protein